MSDEYEQVRRERLAAINADPKDRSALEAAHGAVWDTRELARDFVIVGFLAPLVVVRRRADGVLGSLEFQHAPRFYFGFAADAPQSSSSCPWCHSSNPAGHRRCRECGHDAHVERSRCGCERCVRGSQPEPLTEADFTAALERLRRRGCPE